MKNFSRTLLKFARGEAGNIAVVVSVAFMLVGGAAGAAFEFSRATATKIELQEHLDAATLATAMQENEKKKHRRQFAEQFLSSSLGGQEFNLELQQTADSLIAEASIDMKTTLLGLVGIKEIPVLARTVVSMSSASSVADVVMVLDSTFSMEGAKEDAMKIAAKQLATSVENSEASSTTRVGLVPFSEHINIGLTEGTEHNPGIDLTGIVVPSCELSCTPKAMCTQQCTEITESCIDDGVSTTCTVSECVEVAPYPCSDGEQVCSATGDPGLDRCTHPVSGAARIFKGYVGTPLGAFNFSTPSANSEYDFKVDTNPIPGLTAPHAWNPRSIIHPLTTNMTSLRQAIDDMTMRDETYIAPGVLWGWYMLSGSNPLPSGRAKGEVSRIMVLMSDGANTVSRVAGEVEHDGSSREDADADTLAVCNAAKADGVQIYVVAYDLTDAAAINLLKDCATDPSTMFFNALTSDSLISAFKEISENLLDEKQVRITG